MKPNGAPCSNPWSWSIPRVLLPLAPGLGVLCGFTHHRRGLGWRDPPRRSGRAGPESHNLSTNVALKDAKSYSVPNPVAHCTEVGRDGYLGDKLQFQGRGWRYPLHMSGFPAVDPWRDWEEDCGPANTERFALLTPARLGVRGRCRVDVSPSSQGKPSARRSGPLCWGPGVCLQIIPDPSGPCTARNYPVEYVSV